MVSTRRTAREEPAADMADLSNTLRKKPVRRATAKKTDIDAKPRATRGRRAAGAHEENMEEEVEELPAPALQAKPTRKAAGRSKKDTPASAPAPAVTKHEPVAKKAVIPTRATATRMKKTEVMSDDASAESADSAPKPTRTRRAAAGTIAKPLSPKKITQVSKPQARDGKAPDMKKAAKAAPARGAAKHHTAGRKRAVSDENADVPGLAPTDGDQDEIVVISGTPVKGFSPTKQFVRSDGIAGSDASMSSRSTTPSASPAPSFERMQDEHEYRRAKQDDVESVASAAEEDMDAGDASDDELCGPKTPMRRASRNAEARYLSSVQRTVRRNGADTPAQTPAQTPGLGAVPRRNVIATPKTQKPYVKPAVPLSETRAMTVARGSDRVLVHKPLPDPSAAQQDDSTLLSSPSAQSPSGLDHESEGLFIDDAAPEHDLQPAVEEPEDVGDPEETILVHDIDDQAASPDAQPGASFETEDTVLITRYEGEDISLISAENDNENDYEVNSVSVASPTPETLIWENLRQDLTIPVDFDSHLAGARTLPQTEATERLSIPATFVHALPERDEPSVVAEADEGDDRGSATAEEADDHGNMPVQEALETTINLNDFIDFGALAEPTQKLELPAQEVCPAAEEPPAGDVKPLGAQPENVISLESDFEASLERPIENELEAQDSAEDALDSSLDAEPEVPHYALPTLAFDARRKSLPAIGLRTPIRTGARPNTSDGASMPRMVNAFGDSWWTRHREQSLAVTPRRTPGRSRASTAASNSSARDAIDRTSKAGTPVMTPKERFLKLGARTAAPARFRTPVTTPLRRPATVQKPTADVKTRPKSTLRAQKGGLDAATATAPSTPVAAAESTSHTTETPSERYPRLQPRTDYQEHAKTAAPPSRFRTPIQTGTKRPRTAHKPSAIAATPRASSLRLRQKRIDAIAETPKSATLTTESSEASSSPVVTPLQTPSERFPRLAPRSDYVEHANTVTAPRFHSPSRTPLKRPATVQKPSSLRKAVLKISTPMASHTPMKTPLKPPAMTPAQAPMTPHPAAPLRSVVALVEVYTLEGASASAPFIALLHRLGAKTTKTWNDRVTHVIFKDGSPTTLQRVLLHNKGVDESGSGAHIHCVNSRWISDCDAQAIRVDETDEAYIVDVAEVPRGGRRRRKSMEPAALVNLGGNIVRERKSSLGRSSLGRSPSKFDSPAKQPQSQVTSEVTTPNLDASDKENAEHDELSSPVTPAYLAAPDKLIQQTAPINRMRKLGSKTRDAAKNRRLTYFNGAS